MVVHKLQSYVEEEIPGAIYPANLKQLVNQELKCGRERPTIILDHSACFSLFHSKGTLNGVWKPNVFKKQIENFVESIISCGVNLIVVLRGNSSANIIKWFYKGRSEILNKKKALNAFVEEGAEEGVLTWDFFRMSICLNTTFASIKNNHYKVFKSTDYVHKEVAEIAISQNCLAIIGQDSNYLIYEGIRYYIGTKSLNVETLDCEIYDRNKLIEHLGLKSFHLPLFATLCGNDIVNIHNLNNFHKKIKQPNCDIFLCIAEIIKCFSDDPYNHINDIVNLIKHPKVGKGLIKNSIDMYLNFIKDLPNNKWLVFANERKRNCDWSCSVYDIITLRVFKSAKVTGFDDPNLLPSLLLMRPLRKKIYGILLNKDDVAVAEYLMEEFTDLTSCKFLTPVKVFPVKPVSEHPGLIELFDSETPNVCCLRWNLFCGSISRTLQPSIVKSIPLRLLFPVLALHYLAVEVPSNFPQKIFNEKFEIETFLVVAVLVHENIQVENFDFIKPDLRVTSLIMYFVEACFTLKMLNEACGLVVSKRQSCICNFFDGNLVHSVYKKMKEGANWYEFFEGNFALEVLFSSLMEIILP